MKRHRARRRGFTLIELLVVIAIITVLIAIAMPVYSRAREQARRTACMANLRQLAVSMRLYSYDFGHFPGFYDPATGQGGVNALYPTHLDSRAGLICPDDPIMGAQEYIDQTVLINGVEAYYATLLEAADTMYLWRDTPGFFEEHYSSYNTLYNWVGYANTEGSYSLCDYGTLTLSPGHNLAFWYAWYRWDPEDSLGVWTDPDIFYEIDTFLDDHLAQQVYWADYADEVYGGAQPTRLLDSLGRPLWDPADPAYLPYGMPGASFPGMMNRNAPDNTIITRCPYHRRQTGGKDIVLRLDGRCELIPGLSYDWAVQPR